MIVIRIGLNNSKDLYSVCHKNLTKKNSFIYHTHCNPMVKKCFSKVRPFSFFTLTKKQTKKTLKVTENCTWFICSQIPLEYELNKTMYEHL